MKVKMGNNYSETQYIPSGVPINIGSISLLFLIFINNLLYDIKSEVKLFLNDVILFVRPLSKETTQIDILGRYLEIKIQYTKMSSTTY